MVHRIKKIRRELGLLLKGLSIYAIKKYAEDSYYSAVEIYPSNHRTKLYTYRVKLTTAEVYTGLTGENENINFRVFDKDENLMSKVNILKSNLKHCKGVSILTMILISVFCFFCFVKLVGIIIILIYCYKKKRSVKVESVPKVPESSIKIFVKDSNPRDNTDY